MCDIFVVLKTATKDDSVIFEMQPNETQELIWMPHTRHPESE